MRLISTTVLLISITTASAGTPTSWRDAKNTADDLVYQNNTITFYCGCDFKSDNDRDGSGTVDHTACGYSPTAKHKHRAGRIEWEHVVPASLMPARQFDCWVNGSRNQCEKEDPAAQAMIFDLHNLVPSIGQVNALRSHDRYGELAGEPRAFGACTIEDSKGVFEPADEQRGDTARIWFYMNWKHGVQIPEEEMRMFVRWHQQDPVSDWELERDQRIKAIQGNGNPWVTR